MTYKKSFFILLLSVLSVSVWSANEMNKVSVSFLRCENLVNPQGVDLESPELSWIINSSDRNISQRYYQIIVSSSLEKLNENEGDLWDSKKVKSDASTHIAYVGKALDYGNRCFWKVKISTKNGLESAWSKPAFWTVGFINSFDFKADWIGSERAWGNDVTSEAKTRVSARYVRKEFELTKKIKYATVSFSGLGLSELYVNGDKISNDVLSPALSEYTESAFYVTYDITKNLKIGQNAFGVILGNGRYFTPRLAHEKGVFCAQRNFGYPKLMLLSKIVYEDGTSASIKSDLTWKITGDGPIISNNEFDGEEYDARKELIGWNKPGYDDSKWITPEKVEPGSKRLKAQMINPIRVTEQVKPKSLKEIKPGVYIYDMGQNMVGWAKLKVTAPAGIQVKMRFAEILKSDGTLYLDNIRTANVTDIYTCKGDGIEVFEPRFVYHGFRFVELTGFPEKPDLTTIEGQVVHDDLELTGNFHTSDSTLNQIYKNAYWGIRGNYRSIPTDCPQRDERQGWLGDRAVGSRGESFIFDNSALYAKWLDDIRYSQKENGSLPDVAPTYWIIYSDNITWPISYIFINRMLYDQFGDKRGIEKHYPSMKKWILYMKENYIKNYVLDNDIYGDWCLPPDDRSIIHSFDPTKNTSGTLLSSSFFYEGLKLMIDFATLLGQKQDSAEFASLAKKMSAAYNQNLLDTQNGYYANNTVTSNVLSLAFGLVPEASKKMVFDNILLKVKNEFNDHISTGLVGGMYMMRTLSNNGATNLAYKIATNRDYPSWGYMIEQGATTIWELWNGNTADPAMNSGNHVMLLGDLITWYYEYLAGIKAEIGYQSFKKLSMKPYIPDGLNQVTASYRSPYGLIKSSWTKSSDLLKWEITVPANTEATVFIPAKSIDGVTESTKKLKKASSIKEIQYKDGFVKCKIGSGNYYFQSK